MRADLRRDCDDIWVIDCSPEGLQPEVNTRIFEGVQQPICIVLASRSPSNDPAVPATVRFQSLSSGRREAKFADLAKLSLQSGAWDLCPPDFRGPFLPAFSGGWADFIAIEDLIGDSGLGVMPGRTWVIAPDCVTLGRRWSKLTSEVDQDRRAMLFHPHMRGGLPGDRHLFKPGKPLSGQVHPSVSIETSIKGSLEELETSGKPPAPALTTPIRYSFRSFDRQWIVPDARLLNQPAPKLWEMFSGEQLFMTVLSQMTPTNGPAATFSANILDMDHHSGRGGRVLALWKNAAATQTNVSADAIAALTRAHGVAPDPVDVFAYVAALLAHPAFTERFKPDLIRPGLRVPLTADATLFAEAAKLGREVIWLHSFGDRMAEGRPAGPPRMAKADAPTIPIGGTIPSTPEGFPDTIDYDAAARQLKVGTGFIDNVPPEVWAYQVSGKRVLTQWFSYRKKNRERPQIGDKRPPSPLQSIQPDHWLPEYTAELLNVLNVLGLLVKLEPTQADLLKRVCDGPLIAAGKISST